MMVPLNCARLSQREGGAAYDLPVDDNVHAISADSQRTGTQIVYILAVGDPEVCACIRGALVNRFVD